MKRYRDMGNSSNQKEKGYNVHQARLYSITDMLVAKETFIEREEAIQYIFSCFGHEHDGPCFSRGIIRSIDPVLRAWVSPWGVDNPNALLYEGSGTNTDMWKYAYYDMGDAFMSSTTRNEAVPLEQLEKEMLVLNAFYAVASCHEAEQPEDCFMISGIHRNNKFRLTVIGESRDQLVASSRLRPGEKLEDRYRHLLEQDVAETQRLNDMQWERKRRDREDI